LQYRLQAEYALPQHTHTSRIPAKAGAANTGFPNANCRSKLRTFNKAPDQSVAKNGDAGKPGLSREAIDAWGTIA
jgi:hypothetical protein